MSQQSVEELASKLRDHRAQLKAVEDLLLRKPNDESLLKLRDDVKQVISLTQDLYKLRQKQEKAHSNSSVITSSTRSKAATEWRVGDRCSARWSEDNKWYSARITSIDDQNGLCDVLFLDYNNADKVPLATLRLEPKVSLSDITTGDRIRALYSGDGLFYNAVVKGIADSGVITVTYTDYDHDGEVTVDGIKLVVIKKREASSEVTDQPVIPDKLKVLDTDTESQKLAKKKRVKAIKNTHRLKKIEVERSAKQSAWQSFQATSAKKRRVGGGPRESMFKTPDTFTGRVGVVGSGKGMTEFHSIGKVGKKLS